MANIGKGHFNHTKTERKNKTMNMDDKKQEFTSTVAIKVSSPFINKTESTRTPVKFDCTGVTHKSEQQPNSI